MIDLTLRKLMTFDFVPLPWRINEIPFGLKFIVASAENSGRFCGIVQIVEISEKFWHF